LVVNNKDSWFHDAAQESSSSARQASDYPEKLWWRTLSRDGANISRTQKFSGSQDAGMPPSLGHPAGLGIIAMNLPTPRTAHASPQKLGFNRTKVLHIITLSVIGGAQDNTFGTCELHDRDLFEVHLACNPDGQWIERARRSAEHFHPMPHLQTAPSILKDLRTLWDLFWLLRRERFDIVHTHTAKAGFLGRLASWMARVPVIIHTYHAFPFHDHMPRLKHRFFRGMERLVRSMTDYFFTLSELDRRSGFANGILDYTKSETAYTGIDFAKLDAAAAPGITRAKLAIPEGWQVVLQVGRMDPQKAPHLLVEAFAEVVRVHPKTMLLFAGDGDLRPQVETVIARHGLQENVRILGFRDDVPDLLRVADVFAFSSLWEAMGRAMVEAMLVGRAVVVPAIYGIPEVVHHGETGWLYEAGKVDQLAAGLSHLLAQPEERERLGCNARQLTRRLFDLRNMVQKIEKVYLDMGLRLYAPELRQEPALTSI
jgi:glycosyltransferase involved in cell wall biosynthesis